MLNPTDPAPEFPYENSWPREVVIRPTTEKAIELLGTEYEGPPEGDDALAWKIGFEMTGPVGIESWDEFLEKYKGFELFCQKDQDDYEEFCDLTNRD